MADAGFDRGEFVSYFRDEATELLDRIDADLLGLENEMDQGGVQSETVNALFRSLHTIKGNAGMLDFTVVQRVAHRLENAIDLLRSGKITLDDRLLELTFAGRDMLEQLITRAVGGDTESFPEVEEYVAKVEDFVAHAGDDQAAVRKDPGPEADFTDDQSVAAFEADVARLLAEQSGTASAPASSAESDFSSDASIAAFEAEVARLLAEQTQAPVAAATPAAVATPTPVAAAPAAAVPAVVPKSAAPAAPAAKAAGPASTIRVDLERLDLLLDLVGELVINRTRITAIAHSLQRAIERDINAAAPLAKDLAASSSTLARITNELQESVMKARMVPVGQVFERFPRTVRDLAKTTGKQIQLEMLGVDTDLDKTIVDQIGEPLMHLVRNCADHGIERPEVRVAAGKDPAGTIRLNAYHEGNQVIIEVGDDGGGIAVDKVRARGVERGIIDADGVYSDSEIVDLIFAPGFSTAEQVTGISGRGVGMDVVRKSVVDLKGQLDVDTKVGHGSTFTIRLPLTLAIIRTLLVRVSQRLYAIPLDVVIESQRIPLREVRSISGGAVVTLRGSVVPLVIIRDVFDLNAPRENEDFVMVVIVSHKGRRIGIVVDGFEGDQEIVIKPLSGLMGNSGEIAGATILGNGEIALILDIAALATGLPRSEHGIDRERPHQAVESAAKTEAALTA